MNDSRCSSGLKQMFYYGDRAPVYKHLVIKTFSNVYQFDASSWGGNLTYQEYQYVSGKRTLVVQWPFSEYEDLSTPSNIVEIDDTYGEITKISKKSSFENCTNLKAINFPVLKTIQDAVFSNCNSLYQIKCKEVTSIGINAFRSCIRNCPENISVDLPNLTYVARTSFEYCSKLVHLNCPKATGIGGYTFYGCSTLSSLNCQNLEQIQDMSFANGSKRISLNLSQIKSVPGIWNLNALNGVYITAYVPQDLVEDFKTSDIWSTYYDKGMLNLIGV